MGLAGHAISRRLSADGVWTVLLFVVVPRSFVMKSARLLVAEVALGSVCGGGRCVCALGSQTVRNRHGSCRRRFCHGWAGGLGAEERPEIRGSETAGVQVSGRLHRPDAQYEDPGCGRGTVGCASAPGPRRSFVAASVSDDGGLLNGPGVPGGGPPWVTTHSANTP